MTDKEKAKAYDEALEKARKALSEISLENYGARKIIEDAFPALRESEDERMLRVIGIALTDVPEERFTSLGTTLKDCLAYLEKQKDLAAIPDELIKNYKFFCEEGRREAAALINAINGINEQKEQKPAEWSEEDEKILKGIIGLIDHNQHYDVSNKDMLAWLKSLPERFNLQPKQEWSEEDEHRRTDAIYFLKSAKKHYADTSEIEKTIDWLKSLRPPQDRCEDCPHRGDMFLLTQGFKSGKHELAIEFMNYLDENRPEGKMSLSNAECEDIDNAFKENDWAKIVRYVDKYRPSWKPSEEQMKALQWWAELPICSPGLKSLYEDLKKL